MFCEKCGKKNNEKAQFCIGCGSDLEKQQAEIEKSKSNEKSINYEKKQSADSYAIASLVLGIVSFIIPCIGFVTAIIGLILAKTSKNNCGVKTAGIVLNIIAIVIFILLLLYLIIGPGIENAINEQWKNMVIN